MSKVVTSNDEVHVIHFGVEISGLTRSELPSLQPGLIASKGISDLSELPSIASYNQDSLIFAKEKHSQLVLRLVEVARTRS